MKNYGKKLTLLAATALASALFLGAASSQPVKAATSNSATPVYVYRLYNSSTGEHLYSSDSNEVATLTNAGWSYENVVFDAPSSGTAVDRLYNAASGQHVYSSDPHEQSVLTSSGWKNEGEVFYVSSSSSSSTSLGITRLYNSASGQHLFSSDSNEIKTLTNQGWQNEGIMGYAAVGTSQPKPTLPSNPTPPATTGMNLTQIAKGDYSSIQGTWKEIDKTVVGTFTYIMTISGNTITYNASVNYSDNFVPVAPNETITITGLNFTTSNGASGSISTSVKGNDLCLLLGDYIDQLTFYPAGTKDSEGFSSPVDTISNEWSSGVFSKVNN